MDSTDKTKGQSFTSRFESKLNKDVNAEVVKRTAAAANQDMADLIRSEEDNINKANNNLISMSNKIDTLKAKLEEAKCPCSLENSTAFSAETIRFLIVSIRDQVHHCKDQVKIIEELKSRQDALKEVAKELFDDLEVEDVAALLEKYKK